MTQKVIYFTGTQTATTAEKAAIAALNALTEKPYEVLVFNSQQSPNYGAGPDDADFVAGTIPTQYEDVPVIDPANPPAPELPATETVVSNGQAITVQNSAGAAVAGTHNATVAANTLSNVKLAATIAPVAAGSQTIRDGAGKTSTATRAVSAGAITTTTLAATDCIVKSGDSFNVTGGTVAVTVAAGVPTFVYTAA